MRPSRGRLKVACFCRYTKIHRLKEYLLAIKMRYISAKMLWENYFYAMFERLTPSIIKNPDQLTKITEFRTLHDNYPSSIDYYNDANCSKCIEEFVPFKAVDVIIVHEYIINETCKIRRNEHFNSFKIRINKCKKGVRKVIAMNHDKTDVSGLYGDFLQKLLKPKIEGIMPYLHIHDIPQLYYFTIDQEELTEVGKGEDNLAEPLKEPTTIVPAEDKQHKRIGDFNAVSNDLNKTMNDLRKGVSASTGITFNNIKDPEFKTNEGSKINCNKTNKQNSLSEETKPLPNNLKPIYVQVKPPHGLEKSNLKGTTRDLNEHDKKPRVVGLSEKERNHSKNELNSGKPDGENIVSATLTIENRMIKHNSSELPLTSNLNTGSNNAEIKDTLQKIRSNITVMDISKEPINVKGYGNLKPLGLSEINNEGEYKTQHINMVKRYPVEIKNMEITGSKSRLYKKLKHTLQHIKNETVDVPKDKIINKYKSIAVRPAKPITNTKNNISLNQESQINVQDNKVMDTILNNTADVIITEYDLKPVSELKSSMNNSLKGGQISDIENKFGEECNFNLQKLDIKVKTEDSTSINNFSRTLFPKKEMSDVQMVAFKVMDDEAYIFTRDKHLSSGKGDLVDLQSVIEDEQAVNHNINKPKEHRRTMYYKNVHKQSQDQITSKPFYSKPWKRNTNQKENGSYKINISKSDSQIIQEGNLKINSTNKNFKNNLAQIENTTSLYSTESVIKLNAFKNSKTNPGLTVNAPVTKVYKSTEEHNLNVTDSNLKEITNKPKLLQNKQETVKNKNHDSKVLNVQTNTNELRPHMPNINKNMGETVIRTKSIATFNNVRDRYKVKGLHIENDKENLIKTIKLKQEIETGDKVVHKNTQSEKNNKTKMLYIKTVPSHKQIQNNTAEKITRNTHIQEVLVKEKANEMIKTIKSPKENKNILSQSRASTAMAPKGKDFDPKSKNNNLDFISNKLNDNIGKKVETFLNKMEYVNKNPNLLSDLKKTNEVKKIKEPIKNSFNQTLNPTVSNTRFKKVLLNVNSRNKAMSKSFLNNTPAGVLEQTQLLGKLDPLLSSVSVDDLPQNNSSNKEKECLREGSNIRKIPSKVDISNKNLSSKSENHNGIKLENVKIMPQKNETNMASDSLQITRNGERSKTEIITGKSQNDKLRTVAKVVYEQAPLNDNKNKVPYSKNQTEKKPVRDVHLVKNKSNIHEGKQNINETPTNTNVHKNATIEKSGKLQYMLKKHIPRK